MYEVNYYRANLWDELQDFINSLFKAIQLPIFSFIESTEKEYQYYLI